MFLQFCFVQIMISKNQYCNKHNNKFKIFNNIYLKLFTKTYSFFSDFLLFFLNLPWYIVGWKLHFRNFFLNFKLFPDFFNYFHNFYFTIGF